MTAFNEKFVFIDRVEEQLNELLQHPDSMPNLISFYGEPGCGKTSFADFLIKHLGVSHRYLPMNEGGINQKWIEQNRCWFENSNVLFDQEKCPNKITVLDEFHNLSMKEQDRFKTIFDAVPDTHLVIVICNTTISRSIDKVLSSPILSRLHGIDFNLYQDELDPMVDKVYEKYPFSDPDTIKMQLPDMRTIVRNAELAQKKHFKKLDKIFGLA